MDQQEHVKIRGILKRPLSKEFISERLGPGGKILNYIPANVIYDIANLVFGFDGWSTEVKSVEKDIMEIKGVYNVFVNATVRVTLTKSKSFHEDIGCGVAVGYKDLHQAFEKAYKEAITDATKRALRLFGSALGNCIYDKQYNENISKELRSKTTQSRLPKQVNYLTLDDVYLQRGKKRTGNDNSNSDSDNEKQQIRRVRRKVIPQVIKMEGGDSNSNASAA